MKSVYVILIVLIGSLGCKGQSKLGYSDDRILEAYKFIILHYPDGFIYYSTMSSSDTGPDFGGQVLSYESLNRANREHSASGIFKTTPYVDFDTLLTVEQKASLIDKFDRLPVIELDQNRIKAKLFYEDDVEKLKTATYEEKLEYKRISFPIFQKGKDGTEYLIIAEHGVDPNHTTDPLDFLNRGQILVFRNLNGEWENFCVISSFWLGRRP
ncbi:hypothetical protein [Anditalea andensis]|uniref:Uncharacterized protein n=1 Tax=Anditalea andensis TaxID=1048983 RepID=A0A074L441_9BACT|nr:hypothetical protein [Anditalea andensis]KEO75230.1 hypothetical protein EL17_06100 [Anditalea andensis]